MKIKEWLKLFRAQTAPATVYSILIPYLLAGGDITYVPVIIALGTLIHFATFGHNSVMDYWWDIHDPHKKHHPLEAGTIKLEQAHKVIHTMLIIGLVLSVIVTLCISPNPAIALAMLVLYIIFGHAYNDGLDKTTSLSFIPISLCFTFLVLWGWFLVSSTMSYYMLIIAIWALLTIIYQIAWEGNLKDIFNVAESRNMLRVLNVKYKLSYGRILFTMSKKVNLLFMILRLTSTCVIVPLALALNYSNDIRWYLSLTAYILTAILEVYNLVVFHKTIVSEFITRDYMLEMFGKLEAIAFFNLMSLLFLIDLVLPIVLIIYGIVWFVLMNKVLWGSKFGPRV